MVFYNIYKNVSSLCCTHEIHYVNYTTIKKLIKDKHKQRQVINTAQTKTYCLGDWSQIDANLKQRKKKWRHFRKRQWQNQKHKIKGMEVEKNYV